MGGFEGMLSGLTAVQLGAGVAGQAAVTVEMV
jgi:hypothetical protein